MTFPAEILDAAQCERHKIGAAPSIEEAGGRHLVRGGNFEVLEGDPPGVRTVILEFPEGRRIEVVSRRRIP